MKISLPNGTVERVIASGGGSSSQNLERDYEAEIRNQRQPLSENCSWIDPDKSETKEYAWYKCLLEEVQSFPEYIKALHCSFPREGIREVFKGASYGYQYKSKAKEYLRGSIPHENVDFSNQMHSDYLILKKSTQGVKILEKMWKNFTIFGYFNFYRNISIGLLRFISSHEEFLNPDGIFKDFENTDLFRQACITCRPEVFQKIDDLFLQRKNYRLAWFHLYNKEFPNTEVLFEYFLTQNQDALGWLVKKLLPFLQTAEALSKFYLVVQRAYLHKASFKGFSPFGLVSFMDEKQKPILDPFFKVLSFDEFLREVDFYFSEPWFQTYPQLRPKKQKIWEKMVKLLYEKTKFCQPDQIISELLIALEFCRKYNIQEPLRNLYDFLGNTDSRLIPNIMLTLKHMSNPNHLVFRDQRGPNANFDETTRTDCLKIIFFMLRKEIPRNKNQKKEKSGREEQKRFFKIILPDDVVNMILKEEALPPVSEFILPEKFSFMFVKHNNEDNDEEGQEKILKLVQLFLKKNLTHLVSAKEKYENLYDGILCFQNSDQNFTVMELARLFPHMEPPKAIKELKDRKTIREALREYRKNKAKLTALDEAEFLRVSLTEKFQRFLSVPFLNSIEPDHGKWLLLENFEFFFAVEGFQIQKWHLELILNRFKIETDEKRRITMIFSRLFRKAQEDPGLLSLIRGFVDTNLQSCPELFEKTEGFGAFLRRQVETGKGRSEKLKMMERYSEFLKKDILILPRGIIDDLFEDKIPFEELSKALVVINKVIPDKEEKKRYFRIGLLSHLKSKSNQILTPTLLINQIFESELGEDREIAIALKPHIGEIIKKSEDFNAKDLEFLFQAIKLIKKEDKGYVCPVTPQLFKILAKTNDRLEREAWLTFKKEIEEGFPGSAFQLLGLSSSELKETLNETQLGSLLSALNIPEDKKSAFDQELLSQIIKIAIGPPTFPLVLSSLFQNFLRTNQESMKKIFLKDPKLMIPIKKALRQHFPGLYFSPECFEKIPHSYNSKPLGDILQKILTRLSENKEKLAACTLNLVNLDERISALSMEGLIETMKSELFLENFAKMAEPIRKPLMKLKEKIETAFSKKLKTAQKREIYSILVMKKHEGILKYKNWQSIHADFVQIKGFFEKFESVFSMLRIIQSSFALESAELENLELRFLENQEKTEKLEEILKEMKNCESFLNDPVFQGGVFKTFAKDLARERKDKEEVLFKRKDIDRKTKLVAKKFSDFFEQVRTLEDFANPMVSQLMLMSDFKPFYKNSFISSDLSSTTVQKVDFLLKFLEFLPEISMIFEFRDAYSSFSNVYPKIKIRNVDIEFLFTLSKVDKLSQGTLKNLEELRKALETDEDFGRWRTLGLEKPTKKLMKFLIEWSRSKELIYFLVNNVTISKIDEARKLVQEASLTSHFDYTFNLLDLRVLETLKKFFTYNMDSLEIDVKTIKQLFMDKELNSSFEKLNKSIKALKFLFSSANDYSKMVRNLTWEIMNNENSTVNLEFDSIENQMIINTFIYLQKDGGEEQKYSLEKLRGFYNLLQLFPKKRLDNFGFLEEDDDISDDEYIKVTGKNFQEGKSFSRLFKQIIQVQETIKSIYREGIIERLFENGFIHVGKYEKNRIVFSVGSFITFTEDYQKDFEKWTEELDSFKIKNSPVLKYFGAETFHMFEFTRIGSNKKIMEMLQNSSIVLPNSRKSAPNYFLREQLTVIKHLFKLSNLKSSSIMAIQEFGYKNTGLFVEKCLAKRGMSYCIIENPKIKEILNDEEAEGRLDMSQVLLVFFKVSSPSLFVSALISSIVLSGDDLPVPDEVFICCKETTPSAISTFLARTKVKFRVKSPLYLVLHLVEDHYSNGVVQKRLQSALTKMVQEKKEWVRPLVVIYDNSFKVSSLIPVNIISSGFISLSEKNLLSESKIKEFLKLTRGRKGSSVKSYFSDHSGEGKSYQIAKKALERVTPLYFLNVSGHCDWEIWIQRILGLFDAPFVQEKPSKSGYTQKDKKKMSFSFCFGIGVPEKVELPQEISYFTTQVSLFLFCIVALEGFRSEKAFLHLPARQFHLSLEISFSPRKIIENSLEILKFLDSEKVNFEVKEIKAQNLSLSDYYNRTRLSEALIRVPEWRKTDPTKPVYTYWDDNQLWIMKGGHVAFHIDCQTRQGINSKIRFPCDGGKPGKNSQFVLQLEKHVISKAQVDKTFGPIGFGVIRDCVSWLYNEFKAFSAYEYEKSANIKGSSSLLNFLKRLEKEENENRNQGQAVVNEMIEMVLNFSKSSPARSAYVEPEIIESFNETNLFDGFMRDLENASAKSSTQLSFENLKHVIFWFSRNKLHCFLRDPERVPIFVKRFILANEWLYLNSFGKSQDPKKKLIEKNFIEPLETSISLEEKQRKLEEVFPKVVGPLSENESELWAQMSEMLDVKGDQWRVVQSERNFLLTRDIFVKILIVTKKFFAGYPIIIQGETGTGKTSLVYFLCNHFWEVVMEQNEKLFNKEALFGDFLPANKRIEFTHFMVDAGITEREVIQKLMDLIESAEEESKRLHVVFIDEFNTSNYVDLFSDLLVYRRIAGRHLPQNIKLIGACNPFITKKPSQAESERLQSLKSQEQPASSNPKEAGSIKKRLAYTVSHLTEAELAYVIDFGQVSAEQESSMAPLILRKLVQDFSELNKMLDWTGLFSNLISQTHSFLRKNEGELSVSLRDIKKIETLYVWFSRTYFNEEKPSEETLKKSLLLSWGICYYLRISSKSVREELSTIFGVWLNQSASGSFSSDLSSISLVLESQTTVFVESLIIEKGVSLNKSLCEGLFSLFACLMAKLPIILCGPPGHSKTLSVKILSKNMRGASSGSPILQRFPTLTTYYFQGNKTTKSSEIMNAFSGALKQVENLRINNSPQNSNRGTKPKEAEPILDIVTIVFDELRLAEESEYNPLKVLHSFLDTKQEIGFIGLSNTELDAAKNNRTVFVSIPKMNEQDLLTTAVDISQDEEIVEDAMVKEAFERVIKGSGVRQFWNELAQAYLSFSNEDQMKSGKEFFGARDFYGLVRSVSVLIFRAIRSQNGTQTVDAHPLKSGMVKMEDFQMKVLRNFGGKAHSAERFLEIYEKLSGRHFSKIGKGEEEIGSLLVQDRDNDINSRYQMIITKGGGKFVINELYPKMEFVLLKGIPKKVSPEEKDRMILEDLAILQRVVRSGKFLVIEDYPEIYGALYDLFNKSFRKIDNKLYCEILYGEKLNRFVEVSPQTRIVVVVSQETIDKEQSPLLNRFEKTILNFEQPLMRFKSILGTESHQLILKQFESIYQSELKPILPFSRVFLGCNEEMLKSFVLSKASGLKKVKSQEFSALLQKAIGQMMTMEGLIHIQLAKEKTMITEAEAQEITKGWNSYPHFEDLLKKYKTGVFAVMLLVNSSIEFELSELEAKKAIFKVTPYDFEKIFHGKEKAKQLPIVCQLEEESEIASITRIEKECSNRKRQLFVVVPISKSTKPLPENFFKNFTELNGWRIHFYAPQIQSTEKRSIEKLLKVRELVDFIQEFGITESELGQILTVNLIKSGFSVFNEESNKAPGSLKKQCQLITNLTQNLFKNKSITKEFLNKIKENWSSGGLQAPRGIRRGALSQTQKIQKECKEDFRKILLQDEKINLFSSSFEESIRLLTQKIVEESSATLILQQMFEDGLPQTLVKGAINDRVFIRILPSIFKKVESFLNSAKGRNPQRFLKNLNLTDDFMLPILSRQLEEEAERFMTEVSERHETALKILNKSLSPHEIAAKNKHSNIKEIREAFENLSGVDQQYIEKDIMKFIEKKITNQIDFVKDIGKEKYFGTENETDSCFLSSLYMKEILEGFSEFGVEFGLVLQNFLQPNQSEIIVRMASKTISVLEVGKSIEYSRGAFSKLLNFYTNIGFVLNSSDYSFFDLILSVEPLVNNKNDLCIALELLAIKSKGASGSSFDFLEKLTSILASVAVFKNSDLIIRLLKLVYKEFVYGSKECATIEEMIINSILKARCWTSCLNVLYEIFNHYSTEILNGKLHFEETINRFVRSFQDNQNEDFFHAIYAVMLKIISKSEMRQESMLQSFILNKSRNHLDWVRTIFQKDSMGLGPGYILDFHLHSIVIANGIKQFVMPKKDFEVGNIKAIFLEKLINALPELKELILLEIFKKGNEHGMKIKETIQLIESEGMKIHESEVKEILSKIQTAERVHLPNVPGYRDYYLAIKEENTNDSERIAILQKIEASFDHSVAMMTLLLTAMNSVYIQYSNSEYANGLPEHILLKKRMIETDSVGFFQGYKAPNSLMKSIMNGMKSIVGLEMTPGCPQKTILRNMAIIVVLIQAAAAPRSSSFLSLLWTNSNGEWITGFDSFETRSIQPAIIPESAMKYLNMLSMGFRWRNHTDSYSNNVHLLLECKKCGTLSPLFACNSPHDGKLCNPPQCKDVIDYLYVRNNHQDNAEEFMKKRVCEEREALLKLREKKEGTAKWADISKFPPNLTFKSVSMFSLKILQLMQIMVSHYLAQVLPKRNQHEILLQDFFKDKSKPDYTATISAIDRFCEEIKADCKIDNPFTWLLAVILELNDFGRINSSQNPFSKKLSLLYSDEVSKFEMEVGKFIDQKARESSILSKKYSLFFKSPLVLFPQSLEMEKNEKPSHESNNSPSSLKILEMSIVTDYQFAELSHKAVLSEIFEPYSTAVLAKALYSGELENVDKLESLPSVLSFYHFTTGPLSYQIGVDDSKKKSIKDQFGKREKIWIEFEKNYRKMEEDWNHQLSHISGGLRLGCRTLESMKMHSSLPLEYVLPSTKPKISRDPRKKEAGMQIPAALQTLINVHNFLVDEAIEKYPDEAPKILAISADKPLALQNVEARHIVNLKIKEMEELLPHFLSYQLKVLPGNRSVAFSESCDKRRLELFLLENCFSGKRKIAADEKEWKTYLFRGALAQQDVYLSGIEAQVPQVPIPREEALKLQLYIKRLLEETESVEISSLLSQMESLIVIFPMLEGNYSNKSDVRLLLERSKPIAKYVSFENLQKRLFLMETKLCYFRRVFVEISVDHLAWTIPEEVKREPINPIIGKIRSAQLARDLKVQVGWYILGFMQVDVERDEVLMRSSLSMNTEPLLEMAAEEDNERTEALTGFWEKTSEATCRDAWSVFWEAHMASENALAPKKN